MLDTKVVYDVGSSEPRVWIIGLPAMVCLALFEAPSSCTQHIKHVVRQLW